jgi:hypothetical protein
VHRRASGYDRDALEQKDERNSEKRDTRQELKGVHIRQRCSLLLQQIVGELVKLQTELELAGHRLLSGASERIPQRVHPHRRSDPRAHLALLPAEQGEGFILRLIASI